MPEPKPEPKPEPPPEPDPVPEPLPEPLPEPVAPAAAEVQPLPSPATEAQPTPEAADVVAPNPVDVPENTDTSDTPTPAVSDQPSDAPPVDQPPTPEVVAEDTGDVLLTEANQDQTEAVGMTTSPRPKARPEKPVEPPVEPPPEELVASAEPPPETPADAAATDAAIAAALEEVAAATPAEEPVAEPVTADLPQGPPLTGAEMGDISSSIARKWNLGASSSDTLRTKIVIRVSFSPDGKPVDFELIESDGPTQTAIDKLYETARRAVNRANSDGGLPLPEGKYDTWRVLDLVFDANGMALR